MVGVLESSAIKPEWEEKEDESQKRAMQGCSRFAMVFTIAVLVATVVAAEAGGWPKNPDAQGEFCWVAGPSGSQLDEYSLVIAQITNMGNGHFLYHGKAYRVQSDIDLTRIGPLEPFNGNAEKDGSTVIGQVTKADNPGQRRSRP